MAPAPLKRLQSFVDEVTNILSLLLPVVNLITAVKVLLFENVEYRKDLPVVWHERFADELLRVYQLLQDLQSNADNHRISCVQRRLDWNDELRDDRENFLSTMLQHVLNTSTCKEVVWVCNLAETIKEERQVVVKVKLFNFDLGSCVCVPLRWGLFVVVHVIKATREGRNSIRQQR